MPNRLSPLELTIAWVAGLWVSAVSFWGFLKVPWGVTAVVLAAMPALIVGGLAALTLRARSEPTESRPLPRNLLRLLAPLLVLAAFAAGIFVAPYIRQRVGKSEPTPAKEPATAAKSGKSLAEVRDEWQKLIKAEAFSRFSPEEKLDRKKKFFRKALPEISEYETGSPARKQAIQLVIFWDEALGAAVKTAHARQTRAAALVAEEGWDILEQKLVSDLEKKGISLSLRLHASQETAQVYDQLAMHRPNLILLLGSSSMRDEVLENIASWDRINGTKLSLRSYAIEAPSLF